MSHGIEQRLRNLPKLEVPALEAEYQRLYRRTPPSGLDPIHLRAAVGYCLQQIHILQLRHRMLQTVGAAEAIVEALATGPDLPVLIGMWRGATHLVTLLDHGVVYQGETYTDLEAVAKLISKGKSSAQAIFGRQPKGRGAAPDASDG